MSYKHTYSTYALKDGNLISINDVEKGLKCHCFCPACGEKLIARKGNKKIHHFAHKNKLNCEYGYESTLHLMAKDILSKAKMITIPPVYLHFSSCKQDIKLFEQKLIQIEKVELEKRIGNIVPDIVIYSMNKILLIEIYVTHAINEEKLTKIKDLNLSTIEIDLSKKKEPISYEELKTLLLNQIEEKSWKYNSKEDYWKNEFFKNAETFNITDITNIKCPLGYQPIEDIRETCWWCPYFIDETNNNIKCTGKEKLALIEDFKLKKEDRKDRNKCLKCGGNLINKTNIFEEHIGDKIGFRIESFLCCENTPQCDFITLPITDPDLYYTTPSA